MTTKAERPIVTPPESCFSELILLPRPNSRGFVCFNLLVTSFLFSVMHWPIYHRMFVALKNR
jgi:hypothetical protein